MSVPSILYSGNHRAVERWRREQALQRTMLRRPDLLQRISLDPQQKQFVANLHESIRPPADEGIRKDCDDDNKGK